MKKLIVGDVVTYDGKRAIVVKTENQKVLLGIVENKPNYSVLVGLDDVKLSGIPITDEWLNMFSFMSSKDFHERNEYDELFIHSDNYGPAILKRKCINDEIEYSIAGIIVRTINDLQGLFNVMYCENLAHEITTVISNLYECK